MVGIGGVGAEGDDGLEGHRVTALRGVLGDDEVCDLPFHHALPHEGGGPLHHGIVDPGGGAHQLPLGFILAGPGVVHAGGGQHAAAAGIVGHQRQEEAGGPLLVDAHGLGAVHIFRQNGEVIVGIGEPHLLIGDLGHGEELVQKQLVLPVPAQVEGEEPLKGKYVVPGEIPDAVGVGDDHLLQPHLFHGREDAADPFLIHDFIAPFPKRSVPPAPERPEPLLSARRS